MGAEFRPGSTVQTRPRYTASPLPPYSYVPGFYPHPVSDPSGHLFGETFSVTPPLRAEGWRQCEPYLYGIDLFNHGYYWESHEAWESVWRACGHRSQESDWLKGLIKLAAMAVKLREGNSVGVRRHAKRSSELLHGVCPSGRFAGLDPGEIQDFLKEQSSADDALISDPVRLLTLVLIPELEQS